MNSNKNTPRLLGAAFLAVFVASVAAMVLPQTLLSGSMSDNLVNISNNLTLMRVSILVELVTSIGIVVLAVLLYVVLYKQNVTTQAIPSTGCGMNGLPIKAL